MTARYDGCGYRQGAGGLLAGTRPALPRRFSQLNLAGATEVALRPKHMANDLACFTDVFRSVPSRLRRAGQHSNCKLSFRQLPAFSGASEQSSTPSCADFGWYEFDDSVGYPDLPTDEDGVIDVPICRPRVVDVIARWHEVGGHVDQAAAFARGPESPATAKRVRRRVLIRDYVISTRCFDAPRKYTATAATSVASAATSASSSRAQTPVSSASALAALQDERASPAPVRFAWAIPEIRVMAGAFGNEYAEYLVVGCLGDTVLKSWRRYSDLEAWAARARELGFARSLEAWSRVTAAKCVFRCLDPAYLRIKSHNLELFLQQLLFDVTSYKELLQFFDVERKHHSQEDVVLIQPLPPDQACRPPLHQLVASGL